MALLLLLETAVSLAADGPAVQPPREGYTFYVMPHSHLDLEGLWTYEQAQAFSIRILRQALRMLRRDSQFTFTQDQLQALKPFWDGLSIDDRRFLRRMVRERRFEVATGMWVQPDVNEPDFESLTREFLLAKPWLEKTFGTKILTAWNIDTFGQTTQMPQLYRQAGLRYCFFTRDLPPEVQHFAKNLFYWRSADGSQVLTHLDAYNGRGLHPRYLRPLGLDFLRDLIRRNPPGNDKIMIPWGNDEYLPTESSEQIKQWVREAASTIDIPVKAVLMSTPRRYFEEIERSGVALPTYAHDFNPPLFEQDLRGIWGQRPAQKLMERRAEDILESGEKLSSIMRLYGEVYPMKDLTWAWQRVLANQNHDTMGGSHSDAVSHVAISRYRGAIEAGRQIEADALFGLSRLVATTHAGNLNLVVFNALSFARTEPVRYEVTFFQEGTMSEAEFHNFRLVDPAGQEIPFRVISLSRQNAIAAEVGGEIQPGGGPLTTAVIEFLASQVPGLGYRVYRIEPIGGDLQLPQWRSSTGQISNRAFTVFIERETGSISRVLDRRSGTEVLGAGRYGGNEIVLEEEKGPSMEGGIHFTGSEIRGNQFRPTSITVLSDGLGTTLRVEGPFLSGQRVQEITLYTELPRIDFRTELKGFPGRDGILTVVFPVAHRLDRKTLYETHNAVVERPDGIYAAHTWVDLVGATGGLALLNRGTGGHQIQSDEARLILFRSVTRYQGYDAQEAAEIGDHVFEYSVYPHSGEWSGSGVLEAAHSVNSPLRVIPTDDHPGSLPTQFSFLSVKRGNFEITAFKQAEAGDELILRGHETKGIASRVLLHVGLPVRQAQFANLLEQPGRQAPVHDGDIEFDCRPFEFVTFRLSMKRLQTSVAPP